VNKFDVGRERVAAWVRDRTEGRSGPEAFATSATIDLHIVRTWSNVATASQAFEIMVGDKLGTFTMDVPFEAMIVEDIGAAVLAHARDAFATWIKTSHRDLSREPPRLEWAKHDDDLGVTVRGTKGQVIDVIRSLMGGKP